MSQRPREWTVHQENRTLHLDRNPGHPDLTSEDLQS